MSETNETSRKHARTDDEDEPMLYVPHGSSNKLMKVNDQIYPEIEKYLDLSKPELQKWLRQNGQLVTGRKYDLLLRCVDGQINGRIPGCNKCHHGQMQFDYGQGMYICNGYFDHMSKTPIRCGHTREHVKREPWLDLKDTPVEKGTPSSSAGGDRNNKNQHNEEHAEHQHSEHNCKVESNHPLVDLLEDMAYYHSVLRDENWGYKARAFTSAARAIEWLDFEVSDAHKLGDSNSEEHVERIGKSSAEVIQEFLDSGKKRSGKLNELKAQVKKIDPHQA